MSKKVSNKPAEGDAEARLLIDCEAGLANSVVVLPQAEIAALVEAGVADDNKDAVAYAKTLTA